MANPSRDKGTKAERELVTWLRTLGIPADRAPLRGAHDTGDVVGMPGMVISVKMRRADVRPDWSGWLRGVDRMVDNVTKLAPEVDPPVGLLVVKRTGYPLPARWYAVQELGQWLELYLDVLT